MISPMTWKIKVVLGPATPKKIRTVFTHLGPNPVTFPSAGRRSDDPDAYQYTANQESARSMRRGSPSEAHIPKPISEVLATVA